MFDNVSMKRNILYWRFKIATRPVNFNTNFRRCSRKISLAYLTILLVSVKLIWLLIPFMVSELPLDVKNLPFNLYQFNLDSFMTGSQRFPTVFIIGAMKCGTFALAHFLMQHPDVCVLNEQEYFDHHFYNRTFTWYKDRMPYTRAHQIVVDKTAAYFYSPPSRFKRYQTFLERRYNRSHASPSSPYRTPPLIGSPDGLPSLKFILIVCDPVHRAVSHHEMFRHLGQANLNREQAFRLNAQPNIYTHYGKYGLFLSKWLTHFHISQFLIVDGHKFRHENPTVTLKEVERFLNVSDHFERQHFEKRSDGRFYCHKSWFGCGPGSKGRNHEPLEQLLAAELTQLYQHDMENFTELTGLLVPVNSKFR